MKQSATHVHRKLIPNGIEISLDRKTYQISYPLEIWKEFPEANRQNFADSLTYVLTMYLCLDGHQKLIYNFPHPSIEPYVFESLMYSFGETNLVSENGLKISALIKELYNRNTKIEFIGRPRYVRHHVNRANLKNRSVIPFSFGKDSLLTFALCQEMGIKPYPVFFREPKSPFENRYKKRLAEKFQEEFDVSVTFFPVSPGRLRENDGDFWGWDLLFTQYSLLLLPYLFALKSKYLFWSNEQDCNSYFLNNEGFQINPVFEQSNRWVLTLNHLARNMGSNTIIASIIEPINEIATTYVLHHRYPQVAKYQFSCFAEEESKATSRWCGMCEKCATMYLFFKALGIEPSTVGLKDNLFKENKKKLFVLFDGSKRKDTWRDEQLLAFYLAFKKNSKGPMIEAFKTSHLKEASSREKELRQKFFGIHSTSTFTYELKKSLIKIFQEELFPLH